MEQIAANITPARLEIAEINEACECDGEWTNSNELEIHATDSKTQSDEFEDSNYTESSQEILTDESDEDCAIMVGVSPSASHVGEIHMKPNEEETSSRKSMVYKCKYCDWRSTRKHEIQPHRRIHEEEMKFKCLFCSKSFMTAKGLKCHNQRHIRYKCGLCRKKFTFKTKFNEHFKEKHMKKPHTFKCDECHESFTTKQQLLIHQLGHKKHTCGLCQKSFKQRFQLCQHSKEIHNIEMRRRVISRRCVAYGCNKTTSSIPRRSLHCFPNPTRQLVRYQLWVNNVNTTRKNFQPPPFARKSAFNSCVLCSDHFTKESFEPRSSVNELCNFRKRATLKPDAIPTIFTNLPP